MRDQNKVNKDFMEKPFEIPILHSLKTGYFSQNKNGKTFLNEHWLNKHHATDDFSAIYCFVNGKFESWALNGFAIGRSGSGRFGFVLHCHHSHMYKYESMDCIVFYTLVDLRVVCASTSCYFTQMRTYLHICSHIKQIFGKFPKHRAICWKTVF